jgi:hypothetical protein
VTERDERWHRVEQICQAALDRSLNQRAAFLDAAGGHDDVLRNEADELLAQESAASGFLVALPDVGRNEDSVSIAAA